MAKIISIPSAFVINTKVVGVSKDNADGSSRQSIIQENVKEDDLLFLRHEPNNAYHPNAIQVLTKEDKQIGYLPKEVAEEVVSAIINQTNIITRATWVSGDKWVGVGLRIELVSG